VNARVLRDVSVLNADPKRRSERRYLISGVRVSVVADDPIVRVLDVTMTHVQAHDEACDVTLNVRQNGDSWEIGDERGVMFKLPAETAAPEVTGALTSVLVDRVAQDTPAALVSGVIVAKGDFAVALVGEDWESAIAVAIHLSLRGWSIVTPRYSFVDPDTRTVEPFSKLLYIPSRIIPLLPLQYRRALEASPWYATSNDLGFYGVDPLRAGTTAWVQQTTLRAGLIIDSSRRDLLGLVQEPAHGYIGACLPFSEVGIASASLVMGAIVPTTDAVERWVGSFLSITA
jgi:hypothetical protein